MDIEILKTFLEVARVRHFGKASESLFITQSAVSARIRLLEEKQQMDDDVKEEIKKILEDFKRTFNG